MIKNIILIIAILFSCNSFSQTNTNKLKDFCLGAAAVAEDLPTSLFTSYYVTIVPKTGEKLKKIVYISKITEDGSTVLVMKNAEGQYVILGYAPVIHQGYTMGLGEFVAYQNTNGKITVLKEYTGSLRKDDSNPNIEYLESVEEKIAICIQDTINVTFFIVDGDGYSMPIKY